MWNNIKALLESDRDNSDVVFFLLHEYTKHIRPIDLVHHAWYIRSKSDNKKELLRYVLDTLKRYSKQKDPETYMAYERFYPEENCCIDLHVYNRRITVTVKLEEVILNSCEVRGLVRKRIPYVCYKSTTVTLPENLMIQTPVFTIYVQQKTGKKAIRSYYGPDYDEFYVPTTGVSKARGQYSTMERTRRKIKERFRVNQWNNLQTIEIPPTINMYNALKYAYWIAYNYEDYDE